MRVVLDANVLIAAVATRGLCESIVELCLESHTLLLCEELLEETEEKLIQKLNVPLPIVEEYLSLLRNHSEQHRPAKAPADACRDPNVLMISGLAVSGKAEVIVTGDKDLLALRVFKRSKILNPRGFWELALKTGSSAS